MSQKHIDLLIYAQYNLGRKLLDRNSPFICDQINNAACVSVERTKDEEYFRACDDLKSHIQNLLEGSYTLLQWLYNKGCIKTNVYAELTDEEVNKLKQTRLNWIDWLIEYWWDK
jgi:hypothetical protein